MGGLLGGLENQCMVCTVGSVSMSQNADGILRMNCESADHEPDDPIS